jgi:hypothetical protein
MQIGPAEVVAFKNPEPETYRMKILYCTVDLKST